MFNRENYISDNMYKYIIFDDPPKRKVHVWKVWMKPPYNPDVPTSEYLLLQYLLMTSKREMNLFFAQTTVLVQF